MEESEYRGGVEDAAPAGPEGHEGDDGGEAHRGRPGGGDGAQRRGSPWGAHGGAVPVHQGGHDGAAAAALVAAVAGDNAAANAAPILAALRTEPELFSEVWAISFRSERRWDVHLKNGMEIRLPETDPISAWSRLAVIDRKKAITNRDLAVIDMRLPKQLIVEPNIPVRGHGSQT